MKATALGSSARPLWQPSLPTTQYQRHHELASTERAAIVFHLDHRSKRGKRNGLHDLPEDHPLAQLLRPIRDALELMGSKRADRGATMTVLLRECLEANSSFWAWSGDQWGDVLGRHSRAFRARNQRRVSQSVRLEIAAVAYLHGWFRDVLALGHFKRVFGADAVDAAAQRILGPLKQWGYCVGTSHLSCLCEALLRNESPQLEHLTGNILDRFRRDTAPSKRSLYFQLAKVLAVQGILDAPLPIARPRP